MRIVNICSDDWANFAYDNSRALKSVGLDCDSFVLNKHVFNYPKTSKIIELGQLIGECTRADVVQVFHSDRDIYLKIYKHIDPAKMIIWHTGTAYRVSHRRLNHIFRRHRQAYALGEFEHCGGTYMVGGVENSNAQYTGKNRFAHYPSNPFVKGTDKIIRMMEGYDFSYSKTQVDYVEQKRRMYSCDVYIELFKPELNGRPYGSWGITALEAAAMGKIVITNHLYRELYEREYGDCALIIANTVDEFKAAVSHLSTLPSNEILKLQRKSRKWAKKHSYKATGQRWLEKFT